MLIFMFPPLLRAQHSCSASDWKLKQLTAAVIVIAQVEELEWTELQGCHHAEWTPVRKGGQLRPESPMTGLA